MEFHRCLVCEALRENHKFVEDGLRNQIKFLETEKDRLNEKIKNLEVPKVTCGDQYTRCCPVIQVTGDTACGSAANCCPRTVFQCRKFGEECDRCNYPKCCLALCGIAPNAVIDFFYTPISYILHGCPVCFNE